MIRQMAEADSVLCAVSPQYRAAADAELSPDVRRGAQWETRQIRERFDAADADSARARLLPVLLPGRSVEDIPSWMSQPAPPTTNLRTSAVWRPRRFRVTSPGRRATRRPSWARLSTSARRGAEPGPAAGSGTGVGHRRLYRGWHRAGLAHWNPAHGRPLGTPAGQPEHAEARLAAAGWDLGRVLWGAVGEAMVGAMATTPAAASSSSAWTSRSRRGGRRGVHAARRPLAGARTGGACTGWRARQWRRWPNPSRSEPLLGVFSASRGRRR